LDLHSWSLVCPTINGPVSPTQMTSTKVFLHKHRSQYICHMKPLILLSFLVCFVDGAFAQLYDTFAATPLAVGKSSYAGVSWSTDGSSILYSFPDSSGVYQLYCMEADGHNISQLTIDTNSHMLPRQHPKKAQIGFNTMIKGKHALYFIEEANPKLQKLLINRNIQMKGLDYNPTGNLVSLIGKSDLDKHWNLYSYDFRYNNLNKLTDDQDEITYARWSPTGEFISFTRYQSQNHKSQVEVIHWYGKLINTFSDREADITDASWSPNGYRMVYVFTANGVSRLMICRKDGSEQQEIFSTKGIVHAPDWAPDGKNIIFTLETPEGTFAIWKISLE